MNLPISSGDAAVMQALVVGKNLITRSSTAVLSSSTTTPTSKTSSMLGCTAQ